MRTTTRRGSSALGPDAPVLERPGPEVLAHHVGRGGQPAEQVLALGSAQVAGHALAAPPFDRPEQRLAVVEGPDAAHEVAGARLLDLHDLRTPLAEQAGGERCRRSGCRRRRPAGPRVVPARSRALSRRAVGASPRSRAAKTSFIEPSCLRSSSAESEVAVLCAHWCAMKWYCHDARLPMSSADVVDRIPSPPGP